MSAQARRAILIVAFTAGALAWLSALVGCESVPVGPDATACAVQPDATLAACSDFCDTQEGSLWACDDNSGRCVCVYRRDHVTAVVNCTGVNPTADARPSTGSLACKPDGTCVCVPVAGGRPCNL